ncbi:isopenicillin N synthase family oxygenase [Flavobacterium sp. xlx-214]|uniref:isopenicillin N synthase family dioxygenase n=1 Tax=unclassified Flavobacterium TaxID=196869 RepID=UPI0013D3402B|nr:MULTISPECIES: isopenicillin N synthase family oxygenase [unclassified Flavobacterium]MBA5793681.1 isopenicillin N synthase family oxygenase [Flavobacterium sp. xlx-221]QMI83295.1 isopenicillin N synthase family oxygenase [Flavobacterium sp. xlx-214]
MQNIPSVDLRDFLSDDPVRKQKFVNEIGKAYEEIGFVALKGHFLSDHLVENLYKQVRNFFNLPLEVKEKYEIPGIGGQRGYVSFGKESAKGRTTGDLKEFWHFGQYVDNNPKLEAEYPKNVTVDELPEFNNTGKETYKMLEKTGVYVLRALALFLGLNEFYFDNYVKNGNSILRPIHYPPITNEPKDAVRAAAHGDINLITLLMGAQGKGLQVQNNNGEWIDAIAADDELVINVGDMLSRHTNNRLKSTIHQVVNPPRELWGTSRFSIPFFMHPISEMPLNCLENCIDEEHPKMYDDITAGEFLTERLIELGLIKK